MPQRDSSPKNETESSYTHPGVILMLFCPYYIFQNTGEIKKKVLLVLVHMAVIDTSIKLILHPQILILK